MRINSTIFLLSYALFLFFSFFFVIFSQDNNSINDLICAVSIASASLSLAELFFTKNSIDEDERKQLMFLYYYTKQKSNLYLNKIAIKYEDEAKRVVSLFNTVFDNDDIKIIDNKSSIDKQEKDKIFNKIKDSLDNEYDINILSKYVESLLDVNCPINDESKDNQEKNELTQLLQNAKQKEKNNLLIAQFIIVLGLATFMIILSIKNIFPEYISTINNLLTIFAFLSVVLNLLIKDNYKAKSLKNLSDAKKQILSE